MSKYCSKTESQKLKQSPNFFRKVHKAILNWKGIKFDVGNKNRKTVRRGRCIEENIFISVFGNLDFSGL